MPFLKAQVDGNGLSNYIERGAKRMVEISKNNNDLLLAKVRDPMRVMI